jgi:hypothetical protein
VDLLAREQVALLEYGEVTPKTLRSSARLITRLTDEHYLMSRRVLAHDLSRLDLSRRVFEWNPAAPVPEPDWDQISYHACTRLEAVPLRTTHVCWATERGRRLTGGFAGREPRSSVTHDLMVAGTFISLYLSADRTLASLAAGWTPPAEFLRRGWKGERVPDAVIYRRGVTLVEVLGKYGAEKLREQHRHHWRAVRYWLV